MNRLNALYCFITRGCNLRCRHCYVGARLQAGLQRQPAIDVSLFRDLVGQAKRLGVSYVKLSGGEPLLHPRIGEILKIAGREQIGVVLSTNGVLCTPSLVKELSRIRLRGVSVSLDGADAETHDSARGAASQRTAGLHLPGRSILASAWSQAQHCQVKPSAWPNPRACR